MAKLKGKKDYIVNYLKSEGTKGVNRPKYQKHAGPKADRVGSRAGPKKTSFWGISD